jgi:hypothetical protein
MKKRRPGNIKDERPYDPFPKTGLVKEHERDIRDYVRHFCKGYPGLNPEYALFRAVEIANQAEKAFKAGRGATFKTYLIRHRFKELRRLQDEEDKGQWSPIFRTEEDLAAEQAAERGEEVTPDFGNSNSGERIVIDRQWSIGSQGAVDSYVRAMRDDPVWPIVGRRHRVFIAVRATARVRAWLLANLPILWTTGREQGPVLRGYIEAVVDHLKRRGREADQEAENNDHAPVFLEAERTPVDIRFPRHRSPPRYLPKRHPIMSLDAPVGEDESGRQLTGHDVITPPLNPEIDRGERLRERIETADLTPAERRLADQMLALRHDGGLTAIARALGLNKGYASRLWNRLVEKVQRRK